MGANEPVACSIWMRWSGSSPSASSRRSGTASAPGAEIRWSECAYGDQVVFQTVLFPAVRSHSKPLVSRLNADCRHSFLLVDQDSKSGSLRGVWVRFPPSALGKKPHFPSLDLVPRRMLDRLGGPSRRRRPPLSIGPGLLPPLTAPITASVRAGPAVVGRRDRPDLTSRGISTIEGGESRRSPSVTRLAASLTQGSKSTALAQR